MPAVVSPSPLCDNQLWHYQMSSGRPLCLVVWTITIGIWVGIPGKENFRARRDVVQPSPLRGRKLKPIHRGDVTCPRWLAIGQPVTELGLEPRSSESLCSALFTSTLCLQCSSHLPAPTHFNCLQGRPDYSSPAYLPWALSQTEQLFSMGSISCV